jgi:predicted LPLAT superfamily acyltransferase
MGMSASTEPNWRGRSEAGSAAGLKLTVWIARTFGRTVVRIVLIPIALYFLLVRGEERRASANFLSRVTGRRATLWHVFRHFLTFAQVAADRVYFLTGATDKIPIRLHNPGKLQALATSGKGGIVLAAHLGSFEAARVAGAQHSGVAMKVVLDRAVNQRFMDILQSLNSDLAEAIIDPGQSPATLGLRVVEAIGQGQWVGFLADRFMSTDNTVKCRFFDAPANFALGPFIVAAAFKAPIFCVFPLYVNGVYVVYVEEVTEALDVPRAERAEALQAAANRYAGLLEKYARMAPYNWFNFYDFWAGT